MTKDPWRAAQRQSDAPRRRPELGPVPRAWLAVLCALAVFKAVGLVLVAGGIAAGVAGLMSGDLDTRRILLLGVGGALLRALASWGTRGVAQRIAVTVKQHLRGRLWDRIANGDAEGAELASEPAPDRPSAPARISRDREGEGSVAVLATDGLDDLDEYYRTSLPAIIQAVAVPLLIGIRILGADWPSALIIVLTVPLVPLFMILIGKHTQDRTDEATGALARLANHMTELARGLPVLVGLGRVEEQSRALDEIQHAYRRRTQETLRTAFLSSLALELIATLSVALVAVVLGLRLMNGTVGLEVALIALILAPECFQALREVGTAFHASQNGLSALSRIRRILGGAHRGDVRGNELPVVADITSAIDLPITRTEHQQTTPPAGFPTLEQIASGTAWGGAAPNTAPTAAAAIEVRDLVVQHADRSAPVIAGLDATLSGITAITGPSGAGKSTLLAALAGTLPADASASGWIAGVDPEYVGWAPQTPRAFTTTPWDELTLYGASNPDAMLRELGLHDAAYSAISELSPGELRRLAVARALTRVDRGANVLILDEPTAHLDAKSAARVRDAITRRADRATVVLATHEPETLALATHTVAVASPQEYGTSEQDPQDSAASGADEADVPYSCAQPSTVALPVITDTVRIADGPGSQAIRLPKLRGPAHHALRRIGRVPWRMITRAVRPGSGTLTWLFGILLAFITTGMGLALTAVSGWLIVRASVEEFIMYLLVAIVGVRFFGIGRAVSRYTERLVTHAAAFRATDRLRSTLWRSIAARGAGSRRLLEGGSPVDYLVTLTDEMRDLLPRTIPPLVVGVLSIAAISLTTLFVAPHAALAVAVTLLLAAIAGLAVAVLVARGAARSRIRERSVLVRGTSALATAADELRANGSSLPAVARLDRTGARLARAERGSAWSAGLGSAIVVFACSALAVAVPTMSVGTPGELACVVALLALAATEPLEEFVQAGHRLPALSEVSRRVSPLAAQPEPVSTGTAPAPVPVRELVLSGVAAAYPGTDGSVFRGASGSVRAGGWLVVSGRSGSGKSTLLSVIMGALRATAGTITANGIPLTEIDADSWRSRVAWCPQDAYVFDSSVRANLLIARPRDEAPTDDEMLEVLDRVGLADLVDGLPDGLDTHVGAGGSGLSGGERQRLAVARALLTRADVILLDEPAAHLDRPTAEAMMTDIREATSDKIVVLVSHRGDAQAPAGAEIVRL